jgi:hypothetical protein
MAKDSKPYSLEWRGRAPSGHSTAPLEHSSLLSQTQNIASQWIMKSLPPVKPSDSRA